MTVTLLKQAGCFTCWKLKMSLKTLLNFSSYITSHFFTGSRLILKRRWGERSGVWGSMGQQCICCFTFLYILCFTVPCLPFFTTFFPGFLPLYFLLPSFLLTDSTRVRTLLHYFVSYRMNLVLIHYFVLFCLKCVSTTVQAEANDLYGCWWVPCSLQLTGYKPCHS